MGFETVSGILVFWAGRLPVAERVHLDGSDLCVSGWSLRLEPFVANGGLGRSTDISSPLSLLWYLSF